MKKIIISFSLIIGIFSVCHAQRTVDTCGKYTYNFPNYIAPADAKIKALEQAKIDIAKDVFGENIHQSNTTIVSNKNGKSDIDFFSLGGSQPNGKYIRDTKDPVISIPQWNTATDEFALTVSICGQVQAITNSQISFVSNILRDGTEEKYKSDEFTAEINNLYLHFRSPMDGYMCVYLLDESTQQVFCLLPYRNSPLQSIKVEHDRDYIFFNPDDKTSPDWQNLEGRYHMTVSRDVEYNRIYVIFSPNNFYKIPNTEIKGYNLPREMSFRDFKTWLDKCRRHDDNLTVNEHIIKIKKL